jgi:arylsulfatase A-like enzyme
MTSHIILVSIDTLRADCINASPRAHSYKNHHKTKTVLKTTALDALLRSSVYFNNCYSAAPYTSASHGAYFTGVWPLHNGVYEFFNRKLQKPTIFEYARKQRYKTIFQTDFPIMLGPYLGHSKGVDHYYIEDEVQAFKKLKSYKNKNTVSFFHFGGVHYPYGFHTLKFGGKDYIKKVEELEKKYHVQHVASNAPEDV